MSVAPSFQNFEFLCEPYEVNGKMYIRVRNPKTGTERQVRWYDEKKTAAAPIPKVNAQDAFYKPQKEVLGFTHGYITIFKGDTYAKIDWFRASIARYARWWGWYIISTEEVPADLPAELTPITLLWESVGQDNGELKPEHLIQEAVEALIYEESNSEYVGSVGERLDLHVTVERIIELDNDYGHSTMFLMRDEAENLFVWTTASAKNWSVDSQYHIRGTVKDHKKYKNEKQTILNRCMEVR
jgi:hypothetical protein